MLGLLSESDRYRFWPVMSLLKGWGMDDPAVAAALEPLARVAPERRQYIAHHVPAIVGSRDESFQLLMEICALPEVRRPDFVLRGLAALGEGIDDTEAVAAILPHVRKPPAVSTGEGALVARFHADPRVREFVIARLQEPSPPLAEIAAVYSRDPEVASLVLERAAPLPTVLRRYVARRASQRLDDEALRQVLGQCHLETDAQAMAQATIGLSHVASASPATTRDARTQTLWNQLRAIGPYMDQRRAAAFGGLLALGRADLFAHATETNGKPLEVSLVGTLSDNPPVVALAAEQWEELEDTVGAEALVKRLSRRAGDLPCSGVRSQAT